MTQSRALEYFLIRPVTHAAAHRWVAPVTVTVLNLWFGGTMEPAIRQSPIGFLLFLLMELTAAVALGAAMYFSVVERVLLRLQLYPMTPQVRVRLTLMGLLRSPAVMALIVSAAAIPPVVLHATLSAAVTGALLAGTLTTCAVTGASMLFLIGTKRYIPAGAYLIVLAVIAVAGIVASIPQSGAGGTLMLIPPLLPGIHDVAPDFPTFVPAFSVLCVAVLSAAALVAAGRRHG